MGRFEGAEVRLLLARSVSSTRWAVAVVAATAAVTLLLAGQLVDLRSGAARLRVDSSTDRLLPEGDAAQAFHERVRRTFASRDALVLALVTDSIFTPKSLAALQRATKALEAEPEVERVSSLASAMNVRAVGSEIEIAPFFEEVPADPAVIEQIRRDVEGNPLYAGTLVSADGRAAALVVHLVPLPDAEFESREVDVRLRRAAAEAAPGLTVLLTGTPHIKATTARLILSSLGMILPISLGLIVAIGWVAFRSVRVVLVLLITMILAELWTLGIVAWSGVPLNLVTALVPPLLLAIGFAYVLHLISDYRHEIGSDPSTQNGGEALARALQRTTLPIVLTGVTTVAGFAALLVSPFPAVREFALISMLGVSLSAIASLTFAPAALRLVGVPGAFAHARRQRFDDRLDGWLTRLGDFDVRHRRAIFVASAGAVLLSAYGMTRIEVNTDLVSNFREDNQTRLDFGAINERLGGALPFEIVLETTAPGGFAEPANLREVERLQTWLAADPDLGGSSSLADYVKVLNRAFQGGDPAAFAIPDRARMLKQLLFFADGDEVETLVNADRSAVNIHARARVADSRKLARMADRVEARLAELPAHMQGTVTGSAILLSRTVDDIARSQATSLLVAFAAIFAILALLFASLRVALLALVPNIVPVMVYYGVLGLTGVALNTTTGLFGCIVLGIAVDDTIHFLARFNEEARAARDERTGTRQALRAVGVPVTATTIALCLGFLALTLSELRGQVEFGALGAFVLLCAWGFDVTLTPALCAGLRVVTLWDVLTFDLGDEPHRSLPIFRGLSKAQARIAALMTSVVTFPAGTRMLQAGSPGDEMFVVLEGEAVASVGTGAARIELTRLGRGDVIGEVALHAGTRTANVDAIGDVRVIRLTGADLRRLRQRYPRVAARVLWNLFETVSLRLARLTRDVQRDEPERPAAAS